MASADVEGAEFLSTLALTVLWTLNVLDLKGIFAHLILRSVSETPFPHSHTIMPPYASQRLSSKTGNPTRLYLRWSSVWPSLRECQMKRLLELICLSIV